MKSKIIVGAVFLLLVIACKHTSSQQAQNLTIQVDSLLLTPERYVGKEVSIEGTVVHVCPVNGLKMKLRGDTGGFVKVVFGSGFERFDKSLNHKRVKVIGHVTVTYTTLAYVDSIVQQKTILCHIDNTPCNDSPWIAERKKENVAEQLSKEQTDKLYQLMDGTNKKRVAVVTMEASEVKELD